MGAGAGIATVRGAMVLVVGQALPPVRAARAIAAVARGRGPRLPRMHEPAVALTDFIVAAQTGLFATRAYRDPQGELRLPLSAFFGGASAASLCGGLTHAYFPDERAVGHRALWPATLVAIGVSSLAMWITAARLAFSPKTARRVALAAGTGFAAYCALVLRRRQTFTAALLNYVPASLFLFAALLRRHARTGERGALEGLAGVGLAFAAAGVQARRVAPHPRLFDHNALYHVVQAASFYRYFVDLS